jgi:lysine-N-methylase
VSIDEAAHRKYTSLPPGSLRSLMDASILPMADDSGKTDASPFATIRMLPSGDCPFLSPERLCRIQVEHGEPYLSRTCATFPRINHSIDSLKETEISLSCPEAARLVLLEPHLLPPPGTPGYRRTWDETATSQVPLRAHFWQIREFVLALIQNRAYPLWQRLFLLGTFSRRLDALVRGEIKRSFPALLDDFSQAVASHGLCAAMDSIPADLPLQLAILIRLIAQRVNKAPISARLHEVLDLFAQGVGHSGTASIASQAANYADAYAQFYAPFFHRHPYILENYLINAALRGLFPFGQDLYDPQATPQPARAFAMLAIKFALIQGVMIGVAGARRQDFCAADVVQTVQTVFKYFEHNEPFLLGAHAMLAAKGLDNAHGLTMLLRN